MPRTSDAKEKLLDAALLLVWEHSYGGVTVDMICRRAKVRPGTFYHFFPSKSALVASALQAHWEQHLRPDLERAFASSRPPLERLTVYFELVYEHTLEQRRSAGRVLGCPYTLVGSEVGQQDEVIGEVVMCILESQRGYFETALRDARAQGLIRVTNIPSKVKALSTFVSGGWTTARIHNDPKVIREVINSALRLLD